MNGVPKVGLGFDVHPTEEGRPLWLGGVLFPDEAGLKGHSDGDAVCHAIADALLGSLGMGDIGEYFSELDPSIEGISGRELLTQVVAMAADAGFAVASADVTIICDGPPISPRRQEMQVALAEMLGVEASAVGVKATRPEGLGLSGQGIGCMAVCVAVSA